MLASLILGLLVTLCLGGGVLAQELPGPVPDLDVLCTPMKKKECRDEDLCVWKGKKGGCGATTNMCDGIQARKNGQSNRVRCELLDTSIAGIQGGCRCSRRKGTCGTCKPAQMVVAQQSCQKIMRQACEKHLKTSCADYTVIMRKACEELLPALPTLCS